MNILLCLTLVAAEPEWDKVNVYALDLLQRHIRVNTVNPPADTEAAAQQLAAEAVKAGLEAKVLKAGPEGQTNLIVRLKGRGTGKKPLLLMNHLDVVPWDAKAWTTAPLGGEVKNGFIYGRGTMDMKGIGIQQFVALMEIKKSGFVPDRDYVMVATSDEETNGFRGIRWLIDNHWAEIDAEYALDEGGFITRDILSPDKLVFGIAAGEKQSVWLRLTAKGSPGHGSQPIPDNANDILIAAIQKAKQLPEGARRHPLVDQMMRAIGTAARNKYVDAIQKNTISLTTIEGGQGSPRKANVIPGEAVATLDCRLLPGVNAAEFMSEIKARINDPRVTVELISEPTDPGASNAATPLFAALKRAAEKQHPGVIVTPMLVPHGTDSNKLRQKGVICYGVTPMLLDLNTSAMHGNDEHIPVAEFFKGIRIFYDVLASNF